ncbi:hypothetical protein AYI68_g4734 [Smittium mucronatum]|uniref:RSE1/DDB1/CPSF1 C-terminal domain-containing protein n=1 Tax=Smittium mucronatum TaxID=133383 RepID=A0A1R0GWB8_9FUNG|nr:hypothetical protein AYI68_g4734 [Smittium mucronatum]
MSFLHGYGESMSNLANSTISLLISVLYEKKPRPNAGWGGITGRATLQLYEGIPSYVLETKTVDKNDSSPSLGPDNSLSHKDSPAFFTDPIVHDSKYIIRLSGKLPLPSDFVPLKIVPLLHIWNSAVIFTSEEALFIKSIQVSCGDVNMYKVPFLGAVYPQRFPLKKNNNSFDFNSNQSEILKNKNPDSTRPLQLISNPKRWWESSTMMSKLALEEDLKLKKISTKLKSSNQSNETSEGVNLQSSNSPVDLEIDLEPSYINVGVISGWSHSQSMLKSYRSETCLPKDSFENFYVSTGSGYLLLAEVSTKPSISFYVVKFNNKNESSNHDYIGESFEMSSENLSDSSRNKTTSFSNVIVVLDNCFKLKNHDSPPIYNSRPKESISHPSKNEKILNNRNQDFYISDLNYDSIISSNPENLLFFELLFIGGDSCDNSLVCVSSERSNYQFKSRLFGSELCLNKRDEHPNISPSNSKVSTKDRLFSTEKRKSHTFVSNYPTKNNFYPLNSSSPSKNKSGKSNQLDIINNPKPCIIVNSWIHLSGEEIFSVKPAYENQNSRYFSAGNISHYSDSSVRSSVINVTNQFTPLLDWDVIPLEISKTKHQIPISQETHFSHENFCGSGPSKKYKNKKFLSIGISAKYDSFSTVVKAKNSQIILGATNRVVQKNSTSDEITDNPKLFSKTNLSIKKKDRYFDLNGSNSLRKLQYGHSVKFLKTFDTSNSLNLLSLNSKKSLSYVHKNKSRSRYNSKINSKLVPNRIFTLYYPGFENSKLSAISELKDQKEYNIMETDYHPFSTTKPNPLFIISYPGCSTFTFKDDSNSFESLSTRSIPHFSPISKDLDNKLSPINELLLSGEIIYASYWNPSILNVEKVLNPHSDSYRTDDHYKCSTSDYTSQKCLWIVVFKNKWVLISIYNIGVLPNGNPNLVYNIENSWNLRKYSFVQAPQYKITDSLVDIEGCPKCSHEIEGKLKNITSGAISCASSFNFKLLGDRIRKPLLKPHLKDLQTPNMFLSIAINGIYSSKNTQASKKININTPSSHKVLDSNEIYETAIHNHSQSDIQDQSKVSCLLYFFIDIAEEKELHDDHHHKHNNKHFRLKNKSPTDSGFKRISIESSVLSCEIQRGPISCISTILSTSSVHYSKILNCTGFIDGTFNIKNIIIKISGRHIPFPSNNPPDSSDKTRNSHKKFDSDIIFDLNNFDIHVATQSIATLDLDSPLESCIKTNSVTPPGTLFNCHKPYAKIGFPRLRNGGFISFNLQNFDRYTLEGSFPIQEYIIWPSQSQLINLGDLPVELSYIPSDSFGISHPSKILAISDTSYLISIDRFGIPSFGRLLIPKLEYDNSINHNFDINSNNPQNPLDGSHLWKSKKDVDKLDLSLKPTKRIFKIAPIFIPPIQSHDIINHPEFVVILNSGELAIVNITISPSTLVTSIEPDSFVSRQVIYDTENSCIVSVGVDLSSTQPTSLIKLMNPINGRTIDQIELLSNETVTSICFWEIENPMDHSESKSNSSSTDNIDVMSNKNYRYLLIGTSLKASIITSTGRFVVYRIKKIKSRIEFPNQSPREYNSKFIPPSKNPESEQFNSKNNVQYTDLKIKFVWKMTTGKPISAISPIGNTGFVALGYGNNLSIYQLDISKKIWNECGSIALRWPISDLNCYNPSSDFIKKYLNSKAYHRSQLLYDSKRIKDVCSDYNYWIIAISSLREALNLYSFRLPKYVNKELFSLPSKAPSDIDRDNIKSDSSSEKSPFNMTDPPYSPALRQIPVSDLIVDLTKSKKNQKEESQISFSLFSSTPATSKTNGVNKPDGFNDFLMQDDNFKTEDKSDIPGGLKERFTKQILEKGFLEHLFTAREGYPVSQSLFFDSRFVYSVDRSGCFRIFSVPPLPDKINPWKKLGDLDLKYSTIVQKIHMFDLPIKSQNYDQSYQSHHYGRFSESESSNLNVSYHNLPFQSNFTNISSNHPSLPLYKPSLSESQQSQINSFFSDLGIDQFVLGYEESHHITSHTEPQKIKLSNKPTTSFGRYRIDHTKYALDSVAKFLTRDVPTRMKKNLLLSSYFHKSPNVFSSEDFSLDRFDLKNHHYGNMKSFDPYASSDLHIDSLIVSTISGSFWSLTKIQKPAFMLLQLVQDFLEIHSYSKLLFKRKTDTNDRYFENGVDDNIKSSTDTHSANPNSYFDKNLDSNPDNILNGRILSLYLDSQNFYPSSVINEQESSESFDLGDFSKTSTSSSKVKDYESEDCTKPKKDKIKNTDPRIEWVIDHYISLYPLVWDLVCFWKSSALCDGNVLAINFLTSIFSCASNDFTSLIRVDLEKIPNLGHHMQGNRTNNIMKKSIESESDNEDSDCLKNAINQLSPVQIDSIIELLISDIINIF